jgi:hypothetical protein
VRRREEAEEEEVEGLLVVDEEEKEEEEAVEAVLGLRRSALESPMLLPKARGWKLLLLLSVLPLV